MQKIKAKPYQILIDLPLDQLFSSRTHSEGSQQRFLQPNRQLPGNKRRGIRERNLSLQQSEEIKWLAFNKFQSGLRPPVPEQSDQFHGCQNPPFIFIDEKKITCHFDSFIKEAEFGGTPSQPPDLWKEIGTERWSPSDSDHGPIVYQTSSLPKAQTVDRSGIEMKKGNIFSKQSSLKNQDSIDEGARQSEMVDLKIEDKENILQEDKRVQNPHNSKAKKAQMLLAESTSERNKAQVPVYDVLGKRKKQLELKLEKANKQLNRIRTEEKTKKEAFQTSREELQGQLFSLQKQEEQDKRIHIRTLDHYHERRRETITESERREIDKMIDELIRHSHRQMDELKSQIQEVKSKLQRLKESVDKVSKEARSYRAPHKRQIKKCLLKLNELTSQLPVGESKEREGGSKEREGGSKEIEGESKEIEGGSKEREGEFKEIDEQCIQKGQKINKEEHEFNKIYEEWQESQNRNEYFKNVKQQEIRSFSQRSKIQNNFETYSNQSDVWVDMDDVQEDTDVPSSNTDSVSNQMRQNINIEDALDEYAPVEEFGRISMFNQFK